MASIKFNNVYLDKNFTVAGPLESEGQIRDFDICMDDYYFQEKSFIDAEIRMQRVVLDNLIFKNRLNPIELIIGGDLSNQLAITNFAVKDFKIPFLGVYSACATFNESLIMAGIMIDKKIIKNALVITSSHNLNAERQFRFPIEYGAPKSDTTTFTATASVGVVVTNEQTNIKLESATIGVIEDLDIKDATHMGAVMTPSAASVIVSHLKDLKRDISYYDLVLTGDLGAIGKNILETVLEKNYNIILNNNMDAGCEIFLKSQNVYSGSSGPVTLPLVLFNKVLKNKKYKKILLVATGSLHSKDTTNQKKSIPSISHAISLEVE